jgi:hypothetical protein
MIAVTNLEAMELMLGNTGLESILVFGDAKRGSGASSGRARKPLPVPVGEALRNPEGTAHRGRTLFDVCMANLKDACASKEQLERAAVLMEEARLRRSYSAT